MPTDQIYYRIFDSELGSFTGGSKHLGTLDYVDSLDLSRQEDGRLSFKIGITSLPKSLMMEMASSVTQLKS